MNKLVCQEIMWDEDKKHTVGTVVLNLDNVKWIVPTSHALGVYYLVQFDHSLFLCVEDLPNKEELASLCAAYSKRK